MKEVNEQIAGTQVSREWIAPKLTVLNADSTATGASLNTYEDASYHS